MTRVGEREAVPPAAQRSAAVTCLPPLRLYPPLPLAMRQDDQRNHMMHNEIFDGEHYATQIRYFISLLARY